MSENINANLTKKPKGKRDSRSHEQRVSDLEAIFRKLKAKAIASGIKTNASATKVLEAARVNRTYFYVKDKLKDKVALGKYHKVRDEIQEFQDNFDSFCGDTVVNKLRSSLQDAAEQRNAIAKDYINQQRLVAGLQNDNAALRKKSRLQSEHMIDVVHTATMEARPERTVFGDTRFISPDTYLWRNGKYLFEDENVRQKAWEKAKDDLKKALSRSLPSRVYLLVGPPCSGKSTWAKERSNLYPDLHSIVIDATNLTQFSRLQWVSQINKYRNSKQIRVCAVVFLTPKLVLQSRNNRRESTKQLGNNVIFKKADELEFPNLLQEDIDEMIVVRSESD
jgi:predicted kinase